MAPASDDAPAPGRALRLDLSAPASGRVTTLTRRGSLRVVVALDAPGVTRVRVIVGLATARKLGLATPRGARAVTLGSAAAVHRRPGAQAVQVDLGPGARRALQAATSSLRVRVVAVASAEEDGVAPARQRAIVTLRR
jgi:hypothetical protein